MYIYLYQMKQKEKDAKLAWNTQWVCLKTSKKRAEGGAVESFEFKLLEMISNCNWETSKTKILSKISSQINKEGYPTPRVVDVEKFKVEFLPKAKKPAIIPSDVQSKLPPSIYSIRVKVYKESEVVLKHMDNIITENEQLMKTLEGDTSLTSSATIDIEDTTVTQSTPVPKEISSFLSSAVAVSSNSSSVNVTFSTLATSSKPPISSSAPATPFYSGSTSPAGGISGLSRLQLKIVSNASGTSSTSTNSANGSVSTPTMVTKTHQSQLSKHVPVAFNKPTVVLSAATNATLVTTQGNPVNVASTIAYPATSMAPSVFKSGKTTILTAPKIGNAAVKGTSIMWLQQSSGTPRIMFNQPPGGSGPLYIRSPGGTTKLIRAVQPGMYTPTSKGLSLVNSSQSIAGKTAPGIVHVNKNLMSGSSVTLSSANPTTSKIVSEGFSRLVPISSVASIPTTLSTNLSPTTTMTDASKMNFVSLLNTSKSSPGPVIHQLKGNGNQTTSNSLLYGPFDSLKDVPKNLANVKLLQAQNVQEGGAKHVQLIPVTSTPELPPSLQHLVKSTAGKDKQPDFMAVPFTFGTGSHASTVLNSTESSQKTDGNVLFAKVGKPEGDQATVSVDGEKIKKKKKKKKKKKRISEGDTVDGDTSIESLESSAKKMKIGHDEDSNCSSVVSEQSGAMHEDLPVGGDQLNNSSEKTVNSVSKNEAASSISSGLKRKINEENESFKTSSSKEVIKTDSPPTKKQKEDLTVSLTSIIADQIEKEMAKPDLPSENLQTKLFDQIENTIKNYVDSDEDKDINVYRTEEKKSENRIVYKDKIVEDNINDILHELETDSSVSTSKIETERSVESNEIDKTAVENTSGIIEKIQSLGNQDNELVRSPSPLDGFNQNKLLESLETAADAVRNIVEETRTQCVELSPVVGQNTNTNASDSSLKQDSVIIDTENTSSNIDMENTSVKENTQAIQNTVEKESTEANKENTIENLGTAGPGIIKNVMENPAIKELKESAKDITAIALSSDDEDCKIVVVPPVDPPLIVLEESEDEGKSIDKINTPVSSKRKRKTGQIVRQEVPMEMSHNDTVDIDMESEVSLHLLLLI